MNKANQLSNRSSRKLHEETTTTLSTGTGMPAISTNINPHRHQ